MLDHSRTVQRMMGSMLLDQNAVDHLPKHFFNPKPWGLGMALLLTPLFALFVAAIVRPLSNALVNLGNRGIYEYNASVVLVARSWRTPWASYFRCSSFGRTPPGSCRCGSGGSSAWPARQERSRLPEHSTFPAHSA